jgi:hypothetical protein
MWIDEFSVTREPRSITRTAHPSVGGVTPRLVSVKRAESAHGVSWILAVTSEDCRPPGLDLEAEVSAAGPAAAASIATVQEHDELVGGDMVVEFKGEFARFSPYASGTTRARAKQPRHQDLTSDVRGAAQKLNPLWSPCSAAEVRSALVDGIAALGGDVAVTRTGTCQTGFGFGPHSPDAFLHATKWAGVPLPAGCLVLIDASGLQVGRDHDTPAR